MPPADRDRDRDRDEGRDRTGRAMERAIEADGNADQAHLRIDSHEELCSQRYAEIIKKFDHLEAQFAAYHRENQARFKPIEDMVIQSKGVWWVMGIIGTVCTVLGTVLGPSIIRALGRLF